MTRKKLVYVLFLIGVICSCTTNQPDYKNTSLPFEDRVEDLVSQMTLEEKIGQLKFEAPAIERLDVSQKSISLVVALKLCLSGSGPLCTT